MNAAPLPGHTDEEIVKIAKRANQAVFARAVAILSIAGLGVVGFLAVQASNDARKAATQNRENAIAACERSKVGPDGFRYVVAQDKLRQVQQTHEIGVPNIAARFGIPTKTLKQSQAQQRRVASGLLATDCVAANPKP